LHPRAVVQALGSPVSGRLPSTEDGTPRQDTSVADRRGKSVAFLWHAAVAV